MNRLLAYARLVRPLELLRLVLLLVVAQYSIVLVGLPAEIGDAHVETYFYFLLMAVVLVGAAGFAFNDYCDAKRDVDDGGKMVVVGRVIVRRSVLTMHLTLTLLGIVCGVVASRMVGHLWLALLFPVEAGLLWYYTTIYKRQFVVGNLLKAIMVGACALLPILFEVFYLETTAWRSFALSEITILPMVNIGAFYALIVAFGTLCEQLLMDLYNYRRGVHREKDTLGFRYGVFTAKLVAGGALIIYLCAAVIFFLLLVKFYGMNPIGWQPVVCGILLVGIPLLVSFMALLAAQKSEHFKVSCVASAVSVLGVLLLPALLHLMA